MAGPDIAVTVFNGVIAIAVAVIGVQNRGIRNRAKENGEAARQTLSKVDEIGKQTNGQLEDKIRKAVIEVFKEHKNEVTEAVMAESVRHLLDSMLNGWEGPPRA